MRRAPVFLAGLAGLLTASVAFSPPAQAAVHIYRVDLSPANEVPPTASTATGTVVLTVDDATNEVCQNQLVENLTGAMTAQHIHAGAAGVIGPIVVTFTPGLIEECVTADPSVVAGIVADPAGFYFNVHTAANPGGEIRGQLMAVTPGAPVALEGVLSGAAEVPPNAAPTTGPVAVIVNPVTTVVCVTFELVDQDIANVTGMHIHQAPAGVNGPIVVPFPVDEAACAVAGPTTAAGLVATPEQYYFNIHTAAFPAGEARAQLSAVPAEAPAAEPVPAAPRFTG